MANLSVSQHPFGCLCIHCTNERGLASVGHRLREEILQAQNQGDMKRVQILENKLGTIESQLKQ